MEQKRVSPLAQGHWVSVHTTAGSAGTETVILGVANERGLTLRMFTAVSPTALAASGSAYYLFRPFLVTVKNGVPSKLYFGAGVGTNVSSLVALVPLRIHEKERLNEEMPLGSVAGVDIVTTGSPSSRRVYLQAGYINRAI